jgi:hypothetical protein
MDKYLDNIGLDSIGITRASGIIEINQEFSFKLIEDLQEVSFNSLYAHLLVKFYDAGIFEKNGIKIKKSIINKVNKWFLIRNNLKNSNNSDYINMKAWVNSLYNNELREYTPMILELYRQYMRQFWDDFIEENQFGWLYVDTDIAFISGGVKSLDLIESIGVPFHLTHHEFFYLEGIKKYVIADSTNITIKGHRFQPDEVVGIMKSKMRNKKIDSLLND